MLDFLLFLFGILPEFFIHALVFLGIFGYIISLINIPLVLPYSKFLRPISIAIFLLGVYLEGGLAVTKDYERKLQEWQGKITLAEIQAKEASGKIEYVIQEKVQVVKDTQVVIQEKIRDVAVNIDRECRITEDTVNILNQAARERK